MKIETINIKIVSSEDRAYNATAVCQCCGGAVIPIQQPTGIDYYYTVNDRVISPTCLSVWLAKIGQHIADDPHPYWLHAAINKKWKRLLRCDK